MWSENDRDLIRSVRGRSYGNIDDKGDGPQERGLTDKRVRGVQKRFTLGEGMRG